jgi:hypothetical protein
MQPSRSGSVRRAAWAAAIIAGAVLLLEFAQWSLAGLADLAGMCLNSDVRRVTSPDRRHEAVVFTRDCGATTGWAANVSIMRPGAGHPRGPGNVFRAEWRLAQPDSAGQPAVLVEWRTPTRLRIVFDDRVEPFMQQSTAGRLSLEYVTVRAPDAPPIRSLP